MMKQPSTDRTAESAPQAAETTRRRQSPPSPESEGSLLDSLQKTLDAHLLLGIVLAHITRELGEVGLVFRLADRTVFCRDGKATKHRVTHRVCVDDEDLGVVTIHRSRAFTAAERTFLHEVLRVLDYPLRNALQHLESQRQARCDSLTGLHNRAALGEALEREVDLAQRHHSGFSLTMIDIDSFKAINDTSGHSAGDSVLRQFADILRAASRRSDLLFRYAGDEFVLGTSHTENDGAASIAKRIQKAVATATFHHGAEMLAPVHASIGIATLGPGESEESLFDRADQALYTAKREGRNRIVVDRVPAPRRKAKAPARRPPVPGRHNGDVARRDRKPGP